MRRECLARLREVSRERGETRLARVVNLLVFQPLRNVEVSIAVYRVETDVPGFRQFSQPAVDEGVRVVVVWV